MNISDLVNSLVDKLIAEKEKNFRLEQQIQQQNQKAKDQNLNQTNK